MTFPEKSASSGKFLYSGHFLKRKKPLATWCGALFVSSFLLASLPLFSVRAAPPSPPPKDDTRKKALQAVEKQLAAAKNEEDVQKLWEKAETLRSASLNGATRLLLKAAEEKEETGDIPSMESLLSTALSLQPDNPLLRRLRASVRLKGNDPTGAVQDLGISLQDDPDDPTSWLLLAQTQENLHQPLKALNAFREVLNRVPALPEKDTLLKHFEQGAFGQDD
ncbi:hypothetical protein PT277_09290 [Acetobacteraceae bacterium ESL0709]|nr:hypothetical protein [Acetobacteraceae bacterium ESL0697]MDF7678875.1 hypothetical protein [Acetobacteraceae bacterium ESL0709]